MAALRVTIEIGDKDGLRFEQINALVDTGATYTWIPASVLQQLGHAPEEQRQFVLADGRDITYGLAWLPMRFDGRVRPTPITFGDEGTEPLLGVVTLEEFGLGVDAVNQRLIRTPAIAEGLPASQTGCPSPRSGPGGHQ